MITLQLKRGLKANLPASAPAGAPLLTLDTNELFVGTGSGIKKVVDTLVSATAPSNPISNQIWLDTTTNQIKRYDGSVWVPASGLGATWGNLIGNIDDQADLKAKFDALTAANTTLTTNLAAETTARIAADTNLQNAINAEASTRAAAIAAITSTSGDSVAAETSARQAADTTLQANINAETTARTSADTTLQANINAEATARAAADAVLQAALDAETTARIAADAASQTSVTNETSARVAADAALQAAINAEATARAAADAALQSSKAELAGSQTQVFAVATPTQDYHAATKKYVDGMSQSLDIKRSVKIASTANVSLSAPGASIDGYTLVAGDRILLRKQTNLTENGIYVFNTASTPLVRSTDADNADGEADFTCGLFTFVESGTYAGVGFTCTTPDSTQIGGVAAINLGKDAINFTQFSAAGSYSAGTGLEINGQEISIAATGVATGTYTQVTVNKQGQVTAASSPTTLAAYGITDAASQSALDAETSARTAADTAIQTTVTNEVTARAAADATLQAAINAEATARTSADTTLQANINAEASTRAAADATLTTNLAAETSARQAADTTLQANIDAEVTARIAAISAITNTTGSNLTAETSARQAADTTLQANIDAEVTARQAADAALQSSKAALAGSPTQVFSVANPVSGTNALNLDFADARYVNVDEVVDLGTF
jgi:hypothetical protein